MNRLLLFLITLFSLFLFFYKFNQTPPCLNADETANAYDAYSILKTGKDQYSNFLPLRFKSFGDYKLPLFTYSAIPFIKIFGLNETSIKLINVVPLILLPIVIYYLSLELFKNKTIGLLSALLISLSPGVQTLGRQAHEGYLTGFLIASTFLFFLRVLKKQKILDVFLFLFLYFLSLVTYHSSRIFFAFFFFASLILLWKKQLKSVILPLLIGTFFLIFLATDFIYKPTRVANLLFFKNIGFTLKIDELRAEGGPRIFYNKLTIGIKDRVFEYLKYFSPQFLAIDGDANFRFGFPGSISPITVIEYIFFFVGLYYLFKNKEKYKGLLLAILAFSPIPATLSWVYQSLTRSYFMLIPVLIIVSYGTVFFIKNLSLKLKFIAIPILLFSYLFFNFYSWDFYFHHYPKRVIITRAWQCGYRELVSYIKENYDKFDQFYITRKNGQPYIFLLFYLKVPPNIYQKQAALSPPDEYGFGQVERFDKFHFDFKFDNQAKKTVFIGFPDDFNDLAIKGGLIKKIKVGTEEIFWIYEAS